MSSVIAIVKSLVGQVFALSPDGVQRLLVEGDRLFSGDQVMTGADGRVTLELVDGRILDLGRDSQWSQADLEPAAAPSIAQDAPSVAELQRAISAGDDPTQTLDATAAGPGGTAAGAGNGAAGGGSSYVILEATADQVQPSIGYPTLGLASSAESVEDTPATPLFQATAQPVTPADVAPTTRDQTLATDEDTPLRGAVSAEDGNGDALSYSLGDAPAHGTLVLNADGSFVYTPAANFNGGDRFTVTVDDGQGNRVVSTVVVEVAPVNDAPVANPDSASTPSATPVTIDVLRNDSDVDGDPLTLTGASAANGSVTVNPDGSLSYTPNDGFSGTDTITYGVADGQGGTAGSSVTVTVTAPVPPPQPANTPPEARPDSATTQQNRPVTVNVLANDRDADGDALSVTGASASHGSVTVNANGTLSYTPGSGFTGTDTITYGIADGHGGTASSTVTITVTAPAGPANAAPIATADNASTAIDTPVTVNVLANDRDPDGDALTVTGARADHGSVTVNANGTLSYTPGSGFTGVDTVTYSIADGKGGTASSTVTITVDAAVPTNTAPVAVADSATTTEGTPVTVNVLGNDSDADGDPLTVTGASATNGSVTVNADGTLSYTPGSGFTGVDTVTYSIADGKGGTASSTVTITVDAAVPTNTAPVAVADSATTTAGTPVTVNVLGNDSDADGDPLTVTGANAANGSVTINPDGTLNYTPGSGFTGVDTVTYSIADGKGGTASSTVTITVDAAVPTNTAPVAVADSATTTAGTPVTVNVLGNDSDADGDPLTVTGANAANGSVTINPDGTLNYTPGSGFTGVDTVTYSIADGKGGTASSTVTITVDAVVPTNTAPVAVADSASTTEGTPVTVNVLGNDSDADGDPLTVTGANATNGNVTVNADGTLSYTPGSGFTGVDTVTYSIADGKGGTASSTVTITVNADIPPVIGSGSGSVVEQTQPSVTGNLSATDADNPALAFNPGTLSGTYGNLTLDAAGNWSYSLDGRADGLKQGEQAQDNLTVTLNDGSTTTVSIAITGTNNAPQLQAHSQTVDEDHSASGNLLGNATDVDHDTLSLVDFSVDGVTHAAGSVAVIAGVGSLSVAADGQYSFTPQANWSGTLPTVTYSVSDGTTTAQSSLTIQVTPVADAPLLDLNNPPSHPVATGLTLQTWTGLALGTGGSGAAPATLQSTIDHAGVPAGSGQLSNLANGNVSAGTASKISGLIHLEAGHTYSFSGVGDDSIRLVIGGTVVGQATWGANSGAFSGTFTPTTSGYYTLDLYHHNQNGPGNYDVNFQVDGGALRDLSTANAELFRSTVDLAQEGIRLSALQGTGGQGYYREYAQNEGDEDTAIPLSGVHAALTDTDGSESLHLSIGDIPVGARLSDGSHSFTASAGNTRADLDGWNLDTLSITPPLDFTGHFDLDIGATAVEGANAASAETHLPLTVVVYPESSVPTGPVTGQEGSVQEDVTLSVGSAFGSGGSSFVAGTQSGTYGSLGLTADGRWTYTLDNAAPAVQALVSGQSETETFTLSLSNGTTTTVTVHVLGLDDRAVITPVTPGADRGALVEDNVLTASGTLAVSDPDAGQAGFVAQTLSDGNYGSLSIDASGHWTYTLNNAAQEVQNLKAGDSLTRTLVVTSQDGTSHAITLTIAGANETASAGAGAVQEDTTLSASGTLVASGGATFAAGTQAGTYGSLTLGSDGHWTYVLDNASPQVQALVNGQTETETFTLSLNDGTLTQVAIQVLGLNDTAVIAPAAPGGDRGALVEDSVLTASGTLNVSDADAGQAGFQAQTAVAGQYGHFSVDANGHWTYQLDNAAAQVQALAANEIRTEQFTVTSLDGTPAQVTLTITGTDDAPVIGSGSGSVVEQTQPSVTGSLSATDVDNPALAFNPGTLSGTYGNLTLDAAGNWSYSLDGRADGLKQGEQAQDNLTVTLNDGSTTTVSIAITGTNNAPQLQAHSQTVDEDHSASGNLLGNATDVDHDTLSLVDFSVDGVTHAAGSVAVIAGVGSLSVAADGQYSFTPQANWSGTLPTVTYSVSDGTTTAQSSLTIQVTPVADAPLLDLNNPPSHPVATGLTLQTWTGLALGTGGSGAAPATLQSTVDHAGVPAGSGQLSNLANGNVSAGTASKISGLIHLEAGHTYSFSGVGDDSIRLVIGGTVVGQATWGANSGAFSGTFTPTTSGYYTLDLYHHNQNGPGNYDVNFKVDGGALRDLSTANAELFRSTADLAQEGIRLSALQGTGGQGYYREYAQNEGDEDTAIPLSGVHAALTDTDGSESLHLSIGDIPVGARLSDGSHSFTASAGNTRADLDGWNLDTLSITPPLDFTGHFDLDIGATAVEGANAASAETHLPLTVVVYPAAATPVVPPSGQEGSVHEDVSLSASGAFNVGTAAFVAGTQNGTYGALSMGADGKWTYTLNNASPAVQALVDNQTETDAFTVRLNNGTSTTVTLHVQGQNDAAVIGAATPGSDRGAVTEDAVLTASGTLAVSDLDAGQAGFVAQTLSDGNYGSLSIDASGHWTYTLNNASAAVQGLKGGESLSRELSVHSLDGTPHTLTITLNGTNDTPLSANDSATTREDTPLVLTPATLLGNDSDPDGDRLSIASVQGASHGSVALVNGNVVFTPTADYNGPASFTYTATDGKGGTSTATVALTVEAVNDAPRVSDGSASGTEDGPLVFNWAQFNATDIDSDPSLLTLRIASLPQDGVLQYNSGNAWVNVSAGQTFGKADVDAGKLRFLPDANESGGPAFGTSGVGNLQGHYARFDYQVGDGQLSSPAAPMTLDIAPVADAPTLSVSTGSRALFSTSWESVSNSDSTSETVPGSTLEGWTLITTPDSLSGGKNVFEVWTSGDSQQNAAGNYVNVVIAAGNGSNALELNNASGTLAQTLGIERTVATQAGKVYDLSLDYAGRPGFSTAYTSIAVLVDGKQIASYASTSPNSGLAWQNLHFSFTGTGGNQTIRLVTNATQFNANGRGALIDDLNLTEYQGAIAGNAANGTLTQIALAAYLVSALRDADGSEALSLTVGNLPSGATLVSASHPSGYSVVDGAVTLDAADLPSARVQLDASYTGPLSLTVAAHATEANGLVADSPTQQLDLQVLPGGVTSATITAGGTAGQTLTGTDNADEIHGQNGNDILYGLKGEDALFGGGGNDTLYGGDGNDKLYGEAGSDTLYGGNGNDQLLGGAGNDLLFGEAGDDRLFGGPGNDQLTGGAGKDTFVWQAGDTGQDTIKDFTPGEDHIDLRDLLQGENDGNILDYLRVNTTTSTLEINSSGNFAHGAAADVTIKLETGGAPVDLSHYGATSSQIVNSLIAGADPTVKIDH